MTLDTPRVLSYDQPKTLLANPPAEWIDMLVLTRLGRPESVTRMLAWASRQWPEAVLAVVDAPDIEVAARSQGALFFLPPMSEDDWLALLAGAKQCQTVNGQT